MAIANQEALRLKALKLTCKKRGSVCVTDKLCRGPNSNLVPSAMVGQKNDSLKSRIDSSESPRCGDKLRAFILLRTRVRLNRWIGMNGKDNQFFVS